MRQQNDSAREPAELILDTLAGGVAHHFNNLIGSVLASLQMLRERYGAEAFPAELSSIDGMLAHASNLTRSLSALSSGVDSPPREVPLVDVVDVTLELVKSRMQQREIEVDRMYLRSPRVRVVIAALQWMLLYLLRHAEDEAKSSSGRIQVSIGGGGTDPWLEVGPVASTDGADPEQSPAWRAAVRLSQIAGTHLELRRNAAGGCAHIVFKSDEAMPEESRSVIAADVPRTISVLFMDDEPLLLEMVSSYLGLHGIKVHTAKDGAQGLALAEKQSFDVILLDFVMPGMKAANILAWLADLQPGVPVIVVSGMIDDRLCGEMLGHGAWRVVAKPLQLEHLLVLCREAATLHTTRVGNT